MALYITIKEWLNVARPLLRTDYICLRLNNWRAIVDVVNLRMFLASLVYKEQVYVWFLGNILCE